MSAGTARLRLFCISALMLFVEIFLIRWISTEIRIFAYVSNLVLLACFVGIGIGCFFADRKTSLLWSFGFLGVLALAVRSTVFVRITDYFGGFSDSVIWQQTLTEGGMFDAAVGLALTLCMFALLAAVFVPMGQVLGSLFNDSSDAIIAYSINILGSLVGSWLFALASYLYAPPWVWFSIAVALGFLLIGPVRRDRIILAATAAFSMTVILAPTSRPELLRWSSYQKIEVRASKIPQTEVQNGFGVLVNNIGYMNLVDMSSAFMTRHRDILPPRIKALYEFNQYELPYRFHRAPHDALILGAGGGNDVAGALRRRVPRIDAVEIDSAIYEIGRTHHPEKPYLDPRVRIHINDARSFLNSTGRKYDVISFGLLDSHTLGSNYNNIRLDHFVYTRESFESARAHLNKDGILCLLFMSERPWITDRLFVMLREVFKRDPLVLSLPRTGGFLGYGGDFFVVGLNETREELIARAEPALASFIGATAITVAPGAVTPATDNWPYLYLQYPRVPTTHALLLACLAVLFFAAARSIIPTGQGINWHFAFLGAAFLLFEFLNISRFSLLFGSTWVVNAAVISAILVLALLANLWVYHAKWRTVPWAWAGLGISMIICLAVPVQAFSGQSYLAKATAISVLLNLPILFSGIIFVHSFQKSGDRSIALASNLFGAAMGGMAETLSFVVGFRALIILVAALYGCAFMFRRKA